MNYKIGYRSLEICREMGNIVQKVFVYMILPLIDSFVIRLSVIHDRQTESRKIQDITDVRRRGSALTYTNFYN